MKKISLLAMLMLGLFIGGCSTSTVSATPNLNGVVKYDDISSRYKQVYEYEKTHCVNGNLIWTKESVTTDGGVALTSQIVGSCEVK